MDESNDDVGKRNECDQSREKLLAPLGEEFRRHRRRSAKGIVGIGICIWKAREIGAPPKGPNGWISKWVARQGLGWSTAYKCEAVFTMVCPDGETVSRNVAEELIRKHRCTPDEVPSAVGADGERQLVSRGSKKRSKTGATARPLLIGVIRDVGRIIVITDEQIDHTRRQLPRDRSVCFRRS